MITLSELRSKVAAAPPTREAAPPGWKKLLESDSKVVATAIFRDDVFLNVYENGYVLYFNGQHKTKFSLQDTLGGYTYETVGNEYRADLHIDEDYFEGLPWVVRVLMEAEDRIVLDQKKSRLESHLLYYGIHPEDWREYNSTSGNPLSMVLYKEMMVFMRKSLMLVAEYQRRILDAYIFCEKKQADIAEELSRSSSAVSEAYRRGLKNFQDIFDEIYGLDEVTAAIIAEK